MSSWFGAFSRTMGLPEPRVRRIERRRRVPIPLVDGTVTLADHWTPVGVDRPPLVLLRSPYGRMVFNLLVGRTLAHQGFQVLIQSSRGTDGSGGRFADPFACEIEDGAATVRWLVEQPWYPGSFATYGDSYLGWAQIALADAAAEHLAAMVIRVAPSSLYDMIWPGGAFIYKTVFSWSLMAQVNPRIDPTRILRERLLANRIVAMGIGDEPLLAAYTKLSKGRLGFFEDWLSHPSRQDEYWQRTEILDRLDSVRCPVLVQGGWYDIFLEDSIRQFQRLEAAGARAELMIGPWTHADHLGRALRPTMACAVDFLHRTIGTSRAERPAPVRLIEINTNDTLELPTWPAASAHATWHLADGGRLDPQSQSDPGDVSFRYDPADPTPAVGGAFNDSAGGAKDNNELERRDDVVTFTTDPLGEDMHVFGSPRVTLTFGSDRPETAVFVRLCEVTAAGVSTNITDRIVLLRSADRAADGTWRVTVALPPTCIAVAAGHRLRLQISSGAYPRFARHPGTGTPPGEATEYHLAAQRVRYGADAPGAVELPVRDAKGHRVADRAVGVVPAPAT